MTSEPCSLKNCITSVLHKQHLFTQHINGKDKEHNFHKNENLVAVTSLGWLANDGFHLCIHSCGGNLPIYQVLKWRALSFNENRMGHKMQRHVLLFIRELQL